MAQQTPTARNWLAGALAVAALFAVLQLAGRADAQAEDMASRAAAMRAQLANNDARLQRAAAALCRAELGLGAQALWTREGDLVCRPAVVVAGAEVTQ